MVIAKVGIRPLLLLTFCTVAFAAYYFASISWPNFGGNLKEKVGSLVKSPTPKVVQDAQFPKITQAVDSSPKTTLTSDVESTTKQAKPIKDMTKMIVVSGGGKKDYSWIDERLKRHKWEHIIYYTDNQTAEHHTAQNKGREANAYLTYIIEHYNDLRDITAFVHWERYAWHHDFPGKDLAIALARLRVEYVVKEQYVNLRCTTIPGCGGTLKPNSAELPADKDLADLHGQLPAAWQYMFGEGTGLPDVLGAHCCAQFAVTKEQIRARPKSDYERYHAWLMATDLKDYSSGRMFEFLWHVIFGKDGFHCTKDSLQCWCDMYGHCPRSPFGT